MTIAQNNHRQWFYADEGAWELYSVMHVQGSHLIWRINVQEDGMFSVCGSDSELANSKSPFKSLSDAKAFCEAVEDDFCNGAM